MQVSPQDLVRNYEVVTFREGPSGYAVLTPRAGNDLLDVPAQQSLFEVREPTSPTFSSPTSNGNGHLATDAVTLATVRSGNSGPDVRELGSSSPSPFTGWMRQEYNQRLRGLQGLQVYDEMRKSDSTVRSSLRAVKSTVLGARWYMEPGKADYDRPATARDKMIARFVWSNFHCMSITWPQLLVESLLCQDFGYMMFEKVWAEPSDPISQERWARGKLVWKKLAPRHPMDVIQWNFDRNGGPVSVVMYNDEPNAARDGRFEVEIDIDKLLVFTYDREGGDIAGTSILRSAYKHWYYKDQMYKIDAIQKERHAIGIPVIILPMGFNQNDKALAEEIGRNLRTNERAHVVLPPGWVINMLKLEGQPVKPLESIEHHDKLILRNILAEFMQGTGSRDVDQDMFLKAMRHVAEIHSATFNTYAIKQLVDFNWTRNYYYPKLCVRRLGEQADWRTLSFAIRNFTGAGIIQPDDDLEHAVRDELDLPPLDPETVRQTQAPQAPGGAPGQKVPPKPGAPQPPGQPRVGQPRQAPPTAKPPTAKGTPDKSGGK
jgi:hypothetical protein